MTVHHYKGEGGSGQVIAHHYKADGGEWAGDCTPLQGDGKEWAGDCTPLQGGGGKGEWAGDRNVVEIGSGKSRQSFCDSWSFTPSVRERSCRGKKKQKKNKLSNRK